METVSFIMPTRGRHEMLPLFFDSIRKTTSHLDRIELCMYIDEDDNATVDVCNKDIGFKKVNIIGKRLDRLAECHEIAWKNSTGTIYIIMCDDILIRTKGWDDIIYEEFEKSKHKIIYPLVRDGYYDDQTGDFGFIHKNWTDTLGYFITPYFYTYYLDTWVYDIAKRLECVKFHKEILFEHMHPHYNNKGPRDETYKNMRIRSTKNNEKQIWIDTEKIRINETNKLKKFMREHNE